MTKRPVLKPLPAKWREPSFSTRLKRHAVAVASAFGSIAAGLAGGALANPANPVVVNGQATFNAAGNTLVITNTPGAVINWQSFSIGASEVTKFQQQSASSAVLNRVVGADPSSILGQLQSNGKVFLVNPNGIVFGQGARIDVGGLVASTSHINTADFLAGKHKFEAGAIQGNVVNQGVINAASGGSVMLVGKDVSNQGIIRAPNGQIVLAAGQSVEVIDTATPGVKVVFTATANKAENLGELVGQNVNIAGALLRNKGIINANQVSRDAQGRVVLSASKSVTLESGSTITANGPQAGSVTLTAGTDIKVEGNTVTQANSSAGQGGSISLQAAQGNIAVDAGALIQANGASAITGAALAVPNPGQAGGFIAIQSARGNTTVAGTLDARGIRPSPTTGLEAAPGAALGASTSAENTVDPASGGTVQVLGQHVALVGGATVDASGTDGGGVILVGGDYQGKNALVQNAVTTFVDRNVVLKADAELASNGGKVIVWADQATHFVGSLFTRGGTQGGNGGFAEVSGKEYLYFRPKQVGLGARSDGYTGGTILLDPTDITIQRINTAIDDSTPTFALGGGTFTPTGNATADIDGIEGILNSGGDVTIQTSGGITGTGNITMLASETINKTAGGASSLVLLADNNIVIQTGATISATTGSLGITFIAANSIDINGTASIATFGGSANLNLSANNNIQISGLATVNSNGGNMIIKANADNNATGGVAILDGATILSNGGTINITGTASTGGFIYGVFINGSGTTINSGVGGIAITGTSTSTSSGTNGILFGTSALITASGAGNIVLTGIGSTNAAQSNGIILNAGISYGGIGQIVLSGVGGGDGSSTNNRGVDTTGSVINSTSGSGSITIAGTGGNGTSSNHGIYLGGGFSQIKAGSGNIGLTGVAGPAIGDVGIATTNGSNQIGDAAMTGNITLRADTIDLTTGTGTSILTAASGGTRNVYILPNTPSTNITVGGVGAAGSTFLNNAEIATVSTNVALLTIGEDAAATVSAGSVLLDATTFGNRAVTVAGSTGIITIGGPITIDGPNTLFKATGSSADIVISNSLTRVTGSDGVLKLQAGRDIQLINGADITQAAGANKLDVILNARSTGGTTGGVSLTSGAGSNSSIIDTKGGFVKIGGDTGLNALGTASNVLLDGGQINTSGGFVSIKADAAASGAAEGVKLRRNTTNSANAVIQTGTGNVTITGIGGTSGGHGVHLDGSSAAGGAQITNSGGVTISGIGGAGIASDGVRITSNADVTTTSSGAITINGTGGAATGGGSYGITISNAANLTAQAGDINLTGTRNVNATGGGVGGVQLTSNASVTKTGTGALNIVGTGSATNTTSNSIGVTILNAQVEHQGAGTLQLSGVGGGDASGVSNIGVLIQGTGTNVLSTNAAILINGSGGNGNNNIAGIQIDGLNGGTGAVVRASGTGNVALTGVGGGTAGGGINLLTKATVSAAAGSVNLSGTGVGAPAAIKITDNSTVGGVGTTGDITLKGDSIDIAGGLGVNVQTTGTGNVYVTPLTTGLAASVNGSATFDLSALELGTFNPSINRLFIGRDAASTTAGVMTVGASGAVTFGNNVTLGGTTINISGNTVSNPGKNTTLISSTGDVAFVGNGNVSASTVNITAAGGVTSGTASDDIISATGAGTGISIIASGAAIGTSANPIVLNNAGGSSFALQTLSSGTNGAISMAKNSAIALDAASSITTVPGTAESINVTSLGGGNAIDITAGANLNTDIVSLRSAQDILFNTGSVSITAGQLNLTAAGAVNFSNSAGTVTINAPINTPVGTLTQFTNAGTRQFNGATTSTFAGTVSMSGGTINGSGNIAATGNLSWTGGATVAGTGILNTSGAGTTTLSDAVLNGKTWTNSGNVNVGSSSLALNGGATLSNLGPGTINFTSTGTLQGDGTGTVSNAGTISKSGVASLAFGSASSLAVFANTGTVNVSAGSLTIAASGVDTGTYSVSGGASLAFNSGHTFNGAIISGAGDAAFTLGTKTLNAAGLSFNGSGTFSVSSPASVTGVGALTTGASSTFALSGGTLSNNGGVTVNGAFNWSGGSISGGPPALNTSGTTTLTGGTLSGTWINRGVVNHTSGTIDLSANAIINNTGGSAVWNESVVGNVFTNAASATFNNSAQFNVNSGGISNLNIGPGGPFANLATGVVNINAGSTLQQNAWTQLGTVNINSGATLLVPTATFSNQSGGIINLSGGSINVSGAALTNQSGAFINGSGSINVSGGAGTLNNSGTLRPGGLNTTGTLSINGNLALGAGSILDIELGGTPLSTNFDKINVTGNTTLGGTLNLSEIGGHTVSAGESYAFINGTTAPTNAFGVVNGIAGASGNVSIVGNNVQYNVNALTNEWTGGGSDFLWSTATNWSRLHTPTAGEDADFANDGSINVTAGTGSMFARAIIASGATVLHLTGGSLELNAGATTFATGNTINFSGGQLQITNGGSFTLGTGATMTISGAGSSLQIGPSGGTFTGQGAINVNENFSVTRSGATGVFDLAAAGALNIGAAKVLSIGSGANLFAWNGGTINNVGTGTLAVGGNFDVTGTRSAGVLNVSAGSIAFAGGGMITANTVALSSASGITNSSAATHVIDTSASNGAINLTGQTAAIGSQANPITVNAGTGLVSATTLATFGAGDINLASNNTIRVGSIVNDSVARVGNENAQVQEVRITANGASSDVILTQGLATYDNFTLVAGRHVDLASTGTLEIGQSLNLTAGGSVLSTGAATLDINANVSAFSTGRPSTTVANITGTSIGTAGNYLSYDGYNNQPTIRTTGIGAAGDAYVGVPQSSFIGLPNVTTDAGSAQTINFSGANVATVGNRSYGNDNLAIISSNRFEPGHTISAAAINVTGTAANFVFTTSGGGVLDTSATNGAITLVSQRADGNFGIGGNGTPVRVSSGAGAVSASVGFANIYLTQATGDLSTSQYTLSGVSGERNMHLQADAGHVNINSNINMTGAQMSFAAPGAGKDVIFAGGQLTGHALTINANRNIVNSAPGTVGFTQDGTGGNVFMTLVAGGGIGTASNPLETAHWWVTGLTTSGVGSAGDIYVKNATTGGSGGLRLARLVTDGASAQTIELKQTGVASDAFRFSTNAPGYGGTVNLGSDNLIVDTTQAGSNIEMLNPGATGQNITLRSGNAIVDGSGGNVFFSGVTGSANLSALGAIGTLANPIRIEGGAALNVLTTGAAGDVYLRTDSTALNVGSISTAAGSAQTVNLRSNFSGADLTFGTTSSTNDNWTAQSARAVIFSGTGSIAGNNVNLTAANGMTSGTAANDIVATGTVNLSAAGGIDLDLSAPAAVVTHTTSNAVNLRGNSANMTLAASTLNGQISVSNTGNLTATGAVNAGADAVSLSSTTGSVTQTAAGAVNAASLNVSAATGISLAAASNTVNDFAASNSTGGNINLSTATGTLTLNGLNQVSGGNSTIVNSTGGININQTVNHAGTGVLTLQASGPLSQSGSAPILGARLIAETRGATGANAINLANSGNTAQSISLRALDAGGGTPVAGDITFRNAGALDIRGAGIETLGSTTLTVDSGALSQTTGAVSTGSLSLIGGATITLTGAANQVGTLALNASGAGGTQFRNTTGNLALDLLTQSGGDLDINNVGGAITLNNNVNTGSGALILASTGAVTQAGGTIAAGNISAVTKNATAQNISLTSANSTSGVALATMDAAGAAPVAGTIQFNNAGGVTIGFSGVGIRSTGAVNLTAGGTIAQTSPVIAGTLSLNTAAATLQGSVDIDAGTGGALTVAAGSKVAGNFNLTAGTRAVDFGASVDVGQNASIVTTGAITNNANLHAAGTDSTLITANTITASGATAYDLTQATLNAATGPNVTINLARNGYTASNVQAGAAINLTNAANSIGTLSVNTVNPGVSSSGTQYFNLIQTGALNFGARNITIAGGASNSDVALTNAANSSTGSFVFNNTRVTQLAATGALNLSGASLVAGGSLDVSTSGPIAVLGAINAAGMNVSLSTAPANGITQSAAGGITAAALNMSAGNASLITGTNSVSTLNVTGTDSAATGFKNGAGITVNATQLAGGNIDVKAGGNISVGAANLSGGTSRLILEANGGTVSQTGAITASSLEVTTKDNAGAAITLSHAGNSVSGNVGLYTLNSGGLTAADRVNAPISFTNASSWTVGGTGSTEGIVTLGAVTLTGAPAQSVSQVDRILAGSLALNGTGTSYSLNLGTNEIGSLSANAGGGNINSLTGMTVSALTLNGSVTLSSNGGAANIDASGASVIGTGNLTINSAGITKLGALSITGALSTDAPGSTQLQGSISANAVSISDPVALAGNVTTTLGQTYGAAVTLANSVTLTSTAGSPIAFNATVDATTPGAQSLTVNTAGASAFTGAVGSTTALASLTTDAAGALSANGINTAGAQTLQGSALTLGGTYTTANSTVALAGPVTLAAASSINAGTGSINVGGTIDGAQSLTLVGGPINLTGGTIGSTTALSALNVTGSGALTVNAALTSSGALNLTGSTGVALNGGSLSGSAIGLAGPITLGSATSMSSAATTINGSISGAQSLTVAGPVSLTGAVNTAGAAQSYGAVTLTGNTALTGSAISYASIAGAGNTLTLTTPGGATVNGATVTGLGGLTVGAGTPTTLTGNLTTTGAQAYQSAVTLSGNTTLASGTGNVTFGSTIDAAAPGAQALAINSAGATTFNGAVGGTYALASLTTDAPGTAVLAGGLLKATGAISIGELASITAPLNVSANGVTMAPGGPGALTINSAGPVTFSGGNTSAAVNVTAAGAITQTGPLAAIGALNLTSTGGAVTLGNTGNNFGNVSASAGGGNVTLNDSDGMTLVNIAASGGVLNVTSLGAVGQVGDLTMATINVSGNGVVLSNAGNTFSNATLAGGTALIRVTTASALTLSGTTNAVDVSVNASGLTNAGTINAGGSAVALNARSGNLTTGAINGASTMLLVADAMNVNGAISATSTTINAFSGTTPVTLGAGAGGLGLSNAELGNIAGALTISGNNVTVDGSVTMSRPSFSVSSSTLTVNADLINSGAMTLAASNIAINGARVEGSTATLTGNAISLTGTAGGAAGVTATTGSVALTAPAISLVAGGGNGAFVEAVAGAGTLTADACVGCATLATNPTVTDVGGYALLGMTITGFTPKTTAVDIPTKDAIVPTVPVPTIVVLPLTSSTTPPTPGGDDAGDFGSATDGSTPGTGSGGQSGQNNPNQKSQVPQCTA